MQRHVPSIAAARSSAAVHPMRPCAVRPKAAAAAATAAAACKGWQLHGVLHARPAMHVPLRMIAAAGASGGTDSDNGDIIISSSPAFKNLNSAMSTAQSTLAMAQDIALRSLVVMAAVWAMSKGWPLVSAHGLWAVGRNRRGRGKGRRMEG